MGARDFTTPDGLLNYALRLVFIFLFNVPLLYGGIARALDFTNAATSITPDIRFGFIGHRGMGTIQIWELASTVRGCDFRLRLPAHAWERPTIVRRQLHRHDGILAVCCPCGLMALFRPDYRKLGVKLDGSALQTAWQVPRNRESGVRTSPAPPLFSSLLHGLLLFVLKKLFGLAG
jgi:hypothetical protein